METAAPVFVASAACVIIDAVTAIRLQRRMVRRGKLEPGKARVSSARLKRTLSTLVNVFALVILAAMADYAAFAGMGFSALNYAACAILAVQGISILENEAACNDAPWAAKARKWLADKTERYM